MQLKKHNTIEHPPTLPFSTFALLKASSNLETWKQTKKVLVLAAANQRMSQDILDESRTAEQDPLL